MAVIKEDGSIVANANSYADVADADAYQDDRGRAAWAAATTEVKEAALVRATEYIEGRFALRFVGEPLGDVQTLSWPRSSAVYPRTGNAFPNDEVPADIVTATILYADQVIGPGDDLETMTELSINPELDDSGQVAVRTREKVDVLEEEIEYSGAQSGSAALRTVRPIPEADRLINRWLRAGGGGRNGIFGRV